MDTIPTARQSTTVDFTDDDAVGACICPEFAHGRRELHSAGQPGCVDEVRAS